jgi:hypothetical protein
MFAEKKPLGIKAMDRIRNSHDRNHINVAPSLYPYWKKSFLQAVAECDPLFDDGLRSDWDSVLQLGIDHIVFGYEGQVSEPQESSVTATDRNLHPSTC